MNKETYDNLPFEVRDKLLNLPGLENIEKITIEQAFKVYTDWNTKMVKETRSDLDRLMGRFNEHFY